MKKAFTFLPGLRPDTQDAQSGEQEIHSLLDDWDLPMPIPAQPSKEGKNNSAKLSGRNASQSLTVDNSIQQANMIEALIDSARINISSLSRAKSCVYAQVKPAWPFKFKTFEVNWKRSRRLQTCKSCLPSIFRMLNSEYLKMTAILLAWICTTGNHRRISRTGILTLTYCPFDRRNAITMNLVPWQLITQPHFPTLPPSWTLWTQPTTRQEV